MPITLFTVQGLGGVSSLQPQCILFQSTQVFLCTQGPPRVAGYCTVAEALGARPPPHFGVKGFKKIACCFCLLWPAQMEVSLASSTPTPYHSSPACGALKEGDRVALAVQGAWATQVLPFIPLYPCLTLWHLSTPGLYPQPDSRAQRTTPAPCPTPTPRPSQTAWHTSSASLRTFPRSMPQTSSSGPWPHTRF